MSALICANASQPANRQAPDQIVARISYFDQALPVLERISDFLSESGADALETPDLINAAVGILARHPLIGLRELVISQGRTGYVALDTYEAQYDAILMLAVRQQRAAGFHG